MTSADLSEAAAARGATLRPYRPNPNSPERRRARFVALGLLGFFCFFWGLVFAFLAPALILILIAPVAILILISLWALPDQARAPAGAVRKLFFLYVGVAIIWPFYISLAIPHSGLPWISPQRLLYTPMALIFLFCLGISKAFRTEVARVLRAVPVTLWLMVAFIVIQTYSIFLSDRPFASLNKWADAQIGWTSLFFIGAYLFSKPGLALRWVYIVWAGAIVTGLIGLWEARIHHVLWYGHLPAFLQLDPTMAASIAPDYRNYTTIYRLQSTFQSALGFGEFMSLILPFLVCIALGPFKRVMRLAAFATIPFIGFMVVISNARSGLIGLLIDVGLYALYWGIMEWRRNKNSVIAPALVIGYPVVATLGIGATLFIGRIRNAVWGGGETVSSNEARTVQYQSGIPKVFSHPLGHGIGRAAEILGFHLPGGLLTIDTYYLAIALDYGIPGFVVFYSIFIYTIYISGRYAVRQDGKERELLFLAPAAIALISFLVIKSVYSEINNHYLYYMLLGMPVGLIYRVKMAAPAPVSAPEKGPRRARV